MSNEFTAVIERDGEWFIGHCPEIPGANGQDRREEGLRGVPADAVRDIVKVGRMKRQISERG